MATAQINARIQSDAKVSGDRGLESIGYTPTRAIRALWSYVGNNQHEREKLRNLFRTLEGEAETSVSKGAAERVQRAQEGPEIFERALVDLGVKRHHLADISDEELMEQAFLEKMAERGTLS